MALYTMCYAGPWNFPLAHLELYGYLQVPGLHCPNSHAPCLTPGVGSEESSTGTPGAPVEASAPGLNLT